MLDLSQLAAPLIPHIRTAGETATQWGERIVARLDAIHMAVLDENIESLRQRLPVNLVPGSGRVTVGEVPSGHEWLLEYWFANLTTPGAFIIRSDDEPVYGKTLAVNVDSGGGSDLIISGRSTITVEPIGATAGRMFMQWRRNIPGGRPRRFAGGMEDVTPAGPRVLSPPNEHMPAYPVGKILVRE